MKVDKTKWEKKTLGEICYIYDSQRKPVSKENRIKGIYPYYGATGLQDYVHDYIFDGRYLLLGEDGGKWNAKENSAYIVEGKIWVNNHAHILQFKNNIIDSYICYYLNYSDLMEYITGSIVPKLTQAKMRKIEIPIPPLTEQRDIAAELDAVQKMIEGYKAQLADLDALAQSIFLDMFGDPITNPKGWSKEILKNNAIIGTGATPSRKNPNFYNGNIPWVKSTEVRNCSISFTEEHINQDAIEHSNCSIYPIDTIILAMYGQGKTRGQVALLKIQAATNQACAAIQCKKQLNPIFTFWFFQLTYQANRKLGNGTNQKNMNLSIVGAIPLILPPLSLQQQFAERVEAIERQKELLQAQLDEAQTLMAERMQYYFD